MVHSFDHKRVDQSAISNSLSSLIDIHLGSTADLSQEKQKQYLNYFNALLSSRISTLQFTDELTVLDYAKKRVLKRASFEDCAALDTLFNKLSTNNLSKRKECLHLLLLLSQQRSDSNYNSGASKLLKIPSISHIDSTEAQPELQRLDPSSNPLQTSLPGEPEHSVDRFRPASRILSVAGISVLEWIQDLLYVLQGINGKFIVFSEATQAFTISSKIPVEGPDRHVLLDVSLIGAYYKKINAFMDASLTSESASLTHQSFRSALKQECTNYYRLLAVLQTRVKNDVVSLENRQPGKPLDVLSLRRLYVWLAHPKEKLRIMHALVGICKSEIGGGMLSALHGFVHSGDPVVQDFVRSILETSSVPFFNILQIWLYEGLLDDPFNEFFVAQHQQISDRNFWKNKYTLRPEMIPTFIDENVAYKILIVGKSINFIKHVCQDLDYKPKRTAELRYAYNDHDSLKEDIEQAYKETSTYLLNLLYTKYKLKSHLQAIRNYVLLCQGDLVQILLEELYPKLSQPANTIYRHDLTSILDSSIRSSIAQFDDPSILKRLDVRLFEISRGDIGWDVFLLTYHVDAPLDTILTPQCMKLYSKMFTFLFQLKRVEHALALNWKARYKVTTLLRKQLEKDHLHHWLLVINEMNSFVTQLQYYLHFEVLEASWTELSRQLDDGGVIQDLDMLILCHQNYLKMISGKGLLTALELKEDGSFSEQRLSSRLLSILGTILAFLKELDYYYHLCGSLLPHDDTFAAQVSTFLDIDLSMDLSEQERSKQTKRTSEHIAFCIKQFRLEIVVLLNSLAAQPDESLRGLSVRLNFNQFYKSAIPTRR